ncbi:hypothetical protein pdam_00025081, partial [Pocillopora damicornis]
MKRHLKYELSFMMNLYMLFNVIQESVRNEITKAITNNVICNNQPAQLTIDHCRMTNNNETVAVTKEQEGKAYVKEYIATRRRDKEFRNKQNRAPQAKRSENIEKKRESKRQAFNRRKESNSDHIRVLNRDAFAKTTRDKFCTYFEEGMSASEAFHYHENQLMKDPVTLMLLADRKMCPSLPDVNNLYGKWLIEKKGPSNGSAMFNQLEKIVEDYNRKNANIGGNQSQSCLESCLEQLKAILPSHAFGGKGPDKGSDIFMSDDDTGQRQALRVHWKQATLLLCIFHFLQATWRWLVDSKHSISKDDRQHLMSIMQDLLLSLAFGKPQNLHLAARCFGRTASSVSQSTITIDEKNSCKFHVPSRDDNSTITYIVDCTSGTCTCQQGVSGNACPHQAAVALKLRINNINFIPQTAKERFNLAILAIGDKKNFSVGQFVSLHQKEIESKPPFYGDQEKGEEQQTLLPMPDSPETETMETNDGIIDAGTDATLPNDEVPLDQIIKLHQQVSQDIEYKLRTSDTNFRLCYYKYLTLYRKIISK